MGVGGQQHAPAAYTPRKYPVRIVQEAGWAPGPVWTGGKSRPHRDSIPDRPARSSVAIPTELPAPLLFNLYKLFLSIELCESLSTPVGIHSTRTCLNQFFLFSPG